MKILQFLKNESGQSMVEYVLVLGFVTLMTIALFSSIINIEPLNNDIIHIKENNITTLK